MFEDSSQTIVDLFLFLLLRISNLSTFDILKQLVSSVDSFLGVLGIFPNEETNIESHSDNDIENEPEKASVLKVLSQGLVELDSDLREKVGQNDGNESFHTEGNGDIVNVSEFEDVGLTK